MVGMRLRGTWGAQTSAGGSLTEVEAGKVAGAFEGGRGTGSCRVKGTCSLWLGLGASIAPSYLYDLGQVTQPLCASDSHW